VVFADDVNVPLDSWPEILSHDNVGRVHYLAVRGDAADFEVRLRTLGVIMMEELGITLEDAFRYSYEQGGKGK